MTFSHSRSLSVTSCSTYASRERNKRLIDPWWTYVLPRRGPSGVPMTVPAGAEVLLETRQPYLTAGQRREVLRTTALPSGYPMIDGPELWGRLNLFAAADGYGAADSWKNDISGPGALVKQGTGALTLSGDNSYQGGTVITGGTLAAASPGALGGGPVQVGAAGTLSVALNPADPGEGRGRDGGPARIRGTLEVTGTLSVTLDAHPDGPVLSVAGDARLDSTSELVVAVSGNVGNGAVLPVLLARLVRGTFGSVSVSTSGYRAVAVYGRDGVAVRVTTA